MNKLERDHCVEIRGSAEAIATGVAERLRLMAGPINHVRFDGPAVFTVHGDADQTVPVSQARSLAAAMTAAGQTHEYLEVPGMPHVIGAVWISPEAQSYRTALFDFLAEHL